MEDKILDEANNESIYGEVYNEKVKSLKRF